MDGLGDGDAGESPDGSTRHQAMPIMPHQGPVVGGAFLRPTQAAVHGLRPFVPTKKKGEGCVRVYHDFKQAFNEIARDLNELGTEVFAGYQSKEFREGSAERELMTTKELTDYDYIVTNPSFNDLEPTQPWADAEWLERLDGLAGFKGHNPGEAWELRSEVWEPLLEGHQFPYFSYTYSERFHAQDIDHMIKDMRAHPTTRQCFISVWDSHRDSVAVGKHRVPCTLGYQLMQRNGVVDIAYIMRSSDFQTHFHNDIWMALKLQEWVAEQVQVPPGRFTHKIASLHVYKAAVEHVF